MEKEQNKSFYGQIYWVIPREEEKFKETFKQGKIWHNNLWQRTTKYINILHHYQKLIKEQRNENKKTQESRKKITEIVNSIRKWFKKEYEFLKIESNSDKRPYNRLDLWPYLSENKYEKFNNFYNEKVPEPPEPDDNESLDQWKQIYDGLVEKLAEWRLDQGSKSLDEITNPYEMWLVKQTQNEIIFNWSPPDNIFANFDKFLFNYQGIWYEYVDLDRKEWNRAEFKANYSIYWNDYWYFLKANANGYLHNSPYLQSEICACPDFTQSEEIARNTFVVTNYELKWDLLKAWGGRDKGNWYFAWLNAKTGGTQSSNPDFPWIKLGSWDKVDWSGGSDLSKIKDEITDGKSEQLFSLVSQRLTNANSTHLEHFSKLEAWTDVNVKMESSKMKLTKGKSAKEFKDWIDTEYPKDLSHPKINHVDTTILWRDKTIWKGNLNEIEGSGDQRLYLKLKETSNSSGTAVSFYDKYGNLISQVHESVFIKIGKESQNSVILNTIITTTAAAAIGAATGGVGAAFGAKATAATIGAKAFAGASKAAVAGAVGTAAGGIKDKLLNYGESVRQEFTIEEFSHKFYRSGHHPISLILEQDNELINRYHANRTLKGIEGNQYFNTASLGSYLDKEQFFKAKFMTLNMFGSNSQWFKDKVEQGVRIENETYDKKETDWYRLGLPRKRIASTGAGSSGDIDELIVSNMLHGGSGWDDISHVGGGCWVYKDSFLRNDQGQDLLKEWLMPLYKSKMTREESDKWVFRHRDDFGADFHEIPSRFFDQEKDYCRIDYKLHFFSSNEPEIVGQELHARKIEIKSESNGNQQKITINVHGEFRYTRKLGGEPPEGFNTPPPPIGQPSGSSNLPDNLEPNVEPDPNEIIPSQPIDPIAVIDPLEPNPEPEPDIPEPEEPDPEPEPLPNEPEPDVPEPEPTPVEPTPEPAEPEV